MVLLLVTVQGLKAQSFRAGFLFSPGLTLGGEYAFPADIDDSTSFEYYKWRMQLAIPLKTKVKAELNWDEIKKLNFKNADLKARQDFITLNYSQRKPSTSLIDPIENVHTVSVGYTGLTAGIRNGIWLYSANLFFSESSSSLGAFRPNFMGYFARIKLNNLKTIYFYGAAAVYNQGRIFPPIPIFGFTKKMSKSLRFTLIFPVQVLLTYKVSKDFSIDMATTFSGFNALYRSVNTETINYQHFKSYLSFNQRLDKGFRFTLETGYSWFRRFEFLNYSDDLSSFNVAPAPYVSLNLKYMLGSGLLENKIEGMD